MSQKQWKGLYKNRIEENLDHPDMFEFKDMNLLLNAYEYWRYE